MKNIDDLYQFYKTTLLPDLQVFETKRQQILRKLLFLIIPVIAAVIAAIAILSASPSRLQPFILVIIIIGIVLYILFARSILKNYSAEFKTVIIRKIVEFIDPNLDYRPAQYITQHVFMQSQIFKTEPNIYSGEDLVTGKLGQTQITFSELNAEHESGSGKNRTVTTVFRGLFFVADFNKSFTCRLVVLEDTAQKLLGRFGQSLQALNPSRDPLVKLEDPEFEDLFVAYGTDQIQARYILSTSLMQRIVQFKQKTNREISLSFAGSKIYVAISFTKNLFEPKLFTSCLNFSHIAEYFEHLQLAVGLVDDLNLNTRIWSKS